MESREYEADDGTTWVEWPNVCAGTEPTPGPAPFMKDCQSGKDTVYAETIEVSHGRVFVLEYCEDHRDQMGRFQ